MSKEPEMLAAILEIKQDTGEMKASIATLLRHKSDQEDRIRILEARSQIKQGVFASVLFGLGAAASWIGTKFSG